MTASIGLHVLLVTPTGRDAKLTEEAPKISGVESESLKDVASAIQAFQTKDVGALLIAEESLDREAIALLASALAGQPAWSALPVLILTMGGKATVQSKRQERQQLSLGNTTLLERPIRVATMVSSVRAALHARSGSVAKRAKVVWDLVSEQEDHRMSAFKWRHFEGGIILWAVRWYCRYGISYRDLEQMMGERGVSIDHSTIYRWVQRYAPEMEKRLRRQWRCPRSTSWRVDETYVKVRGQWAYLYRALDKHGNTIDFYLSPTRNARAAKRFLGKALNGLKQWERPEIINTDKAPTYAIAIAELKVEGKCPEETVHRQVKYLNNVVEADQGKLKQLIRPVRGLKTLKTAYATIRGFEVMRALRKGQAMDFNLTRDILGEARIVERAFGVGASALEEGVALLNEVLALHTA